jgi:signal transduction histidine kinase
MQAATLPPDEATRLAELAACHILDTAPEQVFDDITALAAQLCDVPIALISLVDQDRQWFKSQVGLAVPQTHRDLAFCAHAILTPDEVMQVPDAREDERFFDHPLVSGDPGIRFYAGAPIVTPTGRALGTVCVIDQQPRELADEQVEALRRLARLASSLLQARRPAVPGRAAERREHPGYSEQVEQLQAASDASLELLSLVDAGYVYRHVNQTFLDHCQRQRNEIEGRAVVELIGRDAFEHSIRPLLDRALAGETVSYDARFEFPQRGLRQMRVHYLPARAADGRVIGVLVRSQDIQAQSDCDQRLKATITLLEDRNVARQRFMQVLTHDLGEPLGSISNVMALLADSRAAVALPDAALRHLEYVHRGCLGMQAVIDDLLAYLHLDGAVPQLVRLDPAELLREVCAELAPTIRRASAQVSWGDALPMLVSEPALLRVLLQQLIGNAIKFRRPGRAPVVQIGIGLLGAQCRIEVRDNGVGIAPARQARLFDLYRNARVRSGVEGTGLGLATCRRIAELLGGQIGVESVPEQGSCFVVSLPQPVSPGRPA